MEWTCEVCGKKFGIGRWACQDGITNHVVGVKTYRVLDAPSDAGTAAPGSSMPIVRGRTVVCNVPPPKKVMENGEVKYIGEGSVEFINGIFSTKDPEIQYWLDKKPSYNATEDQWKRNWLTDKELLADKEMELARERQRLEHDRNELLEMTKSQKTA